MPFDQVGGWEPPPFSPGRWAAPVWVGILLAAMVMAAPIAAEAYVCADEAAFRREAASRGGRGGPPYMRSRWWPAGQSSLVYDRGRIINTG